MSVMSTQIVGIEADAGGVLIKFRPQGSESDKPPISVRVTPHKNYLNLNLNWAEFGDGGNTRQLPFKKTN